MSEWVNTEGWRHYLTGRGISEDLAAEWVLWARRGIALSHDGAVGQGAMEIGAGKFGGSPDMPSDMTWPERPAYDYPAESGLGDMLHPAAQAPAPLHFLAQIDLAQVAPVGVQLPLPREGLLLFFYDADVQPWGIHPVDVQGFKVIHIEAGTALERRTGPGRSFPCAPVRLGPRDSLPSEEWVFNRLLGRLGYTRDRMHGEMEKLSENDFDEMTHSGHALGGRPREMQGTMEWDCQAALHGLAADARPKAHRELYQGIVDWLLLAQFDSDDALDWCWGDSGKLYFWIRQQDLAACRFDRVWVCLQCY